MPWQALSRTAMMIPPGVVPARPAEIACVQGIDTAGEVLDTQKGITPAMIAVDRRPSRGVSLRGAVGQDVRSYVFIDGTNFFLRHRQIYNGTIDYRRLIPALNAEFRTVIEQVFFYTAPFKREVNETIFYEQVSLLTHLRYRLSKHVPTKVVLGRHQKREVYCPNCRTTYHDQVEKRADVALGTDMVRAACHGDVDVFFLITEDNDFVPAVQACKEEGTDVVLFSLSPLTISDLRNVAKKVVILDRSILYPFWMPDRTSGSP